MHYPCSITTDLKRIPKLSLYLLMCITLFGCGGGGGGDGSDASPTQTQDTSTNNDDTVEESATTTLADNPLPATASFSNFINQTLTLNPSDTPLFGSHRFIKIYDTDGNVYFLGKVHPTNVFEVDINPQASTEMVYVDIFSESSADITKVLEITL